MVIYKTNCKICGDSFTARRSKTAKIPLYCSQSCYSIEMKKKWNNPEYRESMVEKHKENPTNYWLGKKRPNMCGPKNPNWKEEKGFYVYNGYKLLYRPDYKYSNKKGTIPEHVYNWTKHNDCKEPKGYVLHHINENKLDNRIENLRLMTRSAHYKLHRKHGTKNIKQE